MFKDGSYRIYAISHTSANPMERFVARFLINNSEFHVLEDYENLLSGNLPEGHLDEVHCKLIWKLLHSGYFKVVHEEDGNQGAYDPLIQEFDTGGHQPPDAIYTITDNLNEYEEPKTLEMFGDSAFLNGQSISDEELRQLVEAANSGAIKMVPN